MKVDDPNRLTFLQHLDIEVGDILRPHGFSLKTYTKKRETFYVGYYEEVINRNCSGVFCWHFFDCGELAKLEVSGRIEPRVGLDKVWEFPKGISTDLREYKTLQEIGEEVKRAACEFWTEYAVFKKKKWRKAVPGVV